MSKQNGRIPPAGVPASERETSRPSDLRDTQLRPMSVSVKHREILVTLPAARMIDAQGNPYRCGRHINVKLTEKGAAGLRLVIDGMVHAQTMRAPRGGAQVVNAVLEAIVDAYDQ